jgi:cytochrome P450
LDDTPKAGFETSGSIMTYTINLLAKHPDVAEQMYQEVKAVCGDSEDITMDMLNDLQFVWW